MSIISSPFPASLSPVLHSRLLFPHPIAPPPASIAPPRAATRLRRRAADCYSSIDCALPYLRLPIAALPPAPNRALLRLWLPSVPRLRRLQLPIMLPPADRGASGVLFLQQLLFPHLDCSAPASDHAVTARIWPTLPSTIHHQNHPPSASLILPDSLPDRATCISPARCSDCLTSCDMEWFLADRRRIRNPNAVRIQSI
jgi:hypothetical protein